MTAEDRPAFAEAMHALGETFNEPVSDIRAEAYFDALSDYSLAEVNTAVRVALRRCKFFPRPAELRELLDGNAEDNAEVAWGAVLREIRRVGYMGIPNLDPRVLRAVNEMWGGWRRLCETLPGEGPELIGWAKQFKSAYQATERVETTKRLTEETLHPRVLGFINRERARISGQTQ